MINPEQVSKEQQILVSTDSQLRNEIVRQRRDIDLLKECLSRFMGVFSDGVLDHCSKREMPRK